MDKIKTVKDVEFYIERAIETDRALPRVGQKPYQSPLGKWQTSEDFLMSVNDQLEESEREGRRQSVIYDPSEVDDWWTVMTDWLGALDAEDKHIVLRRCGGQGWKAIAYVYHIDRHTAKRRYDKALDKILFLTKA